MRRRLLGSAGLIALGALASCTVPPAVTPSTTPAPASNAAATMLSKLIAYAQGGLSSLAAVAAQFGVQTAGSVPGAISSAGALIASVAQAASSAVTAAQKALGSVNVAGVVSLLTNAANVLLGVLSAAPGTSSAVGIIKDVLALGPTITQLANSIVNPTAVSAAPPFNNGAAARLGIFA